MTMWLQVLTMRAYLAHVDRSDRHCLSHLFSPSHILLIPLLSTSYRPTTLRQCATRNQHWKLAQAAISTFQDLPKPGNFSNVLALWLIRRCCEQGVKMFIFLHTPFRPVKKDGMNTGTHFWLTVHSHHIINPGAVIHWQFMFLQKQFNGSQIILDQLYSYLLGPLPSLIHCLNKRNCRPELPESSSEL